MDEKLAVELAYKNGYEQAIKEFTKRLEDISAERFVFEGYGENRILNIVEFGDIYNLSKELLKGRAKG